MSTEDVQLNRHVFDLLEEDFERIITECDTIGSVDEEAGCVEDDATCKGSLL
jgi:hypothetical protein